MHEETKPAVADAIELDPSVEGHSSGRRTLLKMGLAGTAGLLAGITPGSPARRSTDAARTALALPYAKSVVFIASKTLVSDGHGNTAEYLLNGSGSLFINAAGEARLVGLKIVGEPVGAKSEAGRLTIESAAGNDRGQYVDGQLTAAGAVRFSGGRVREQVGRASLTGELFAEQGSVVMSVDFPGHATLQRIVIGKRSFNC